MIYTHGNRLGMHNSSKPKNQISHGTYEMEENDERYFIKPTGNIVEARGSCTMPDTFDTPEIDFDWMNKTFDIELHHNTEKLLGVTMDEFDKMIESIVPDAVKQCVSDLIEETIKTSEMEESFDDAVARIHMKDLSRSNSLASVSSVSDDELMEVSDNEQDNDDVRSGLVDIFELPNLTEEQIQQMDPGYNCQLNNTRDQLERVTQELETSRKNHREDDSAYMEELNEKDRLLEEKENEIEELRSQLRKRSREEYEVEEVQHDLIQMNMISGKQPRSKPVEVQEPEVREVKRQKITEGRRGCPFCPYEQTSSGYDMRPLRLHMCNGSCSVPTDEMNTSECKYANNWCEVGDSGFDVLRKMGFANVEDHVNDFLRYRCPCEGCDFKHYHARKFKRHLMTKRQKNHGFSKEEAGQIAQRQMLGDYAV